MFAAVLKPDEKQSAPNLLVWSNLYFLKMLFIPPVVEPNYWAKSRNVFIGNETPLTVKRLRLNHLKRNLATSAKAVG